MTKQNRLSLLGIVDDIGMVFLALVSAGLLVLEYATPLPPAQTHILDVVDVTIACIFLAEFLIKLLIAKEKGMYFKKHWWELLASIPITTPATQALRLLRLLRLIRLFRLNTGLRNIFDYLGQFVEDTHAIGVIFVWFLIVFGGAGAFFALEHMAHSPPLSLFDSVWWAVSTMTTVGYGDIYPLTVGGRIVAMILMVCGIGTTGIFTALVASFFLKEK